MPVPTIVQGYTGLTQQTQIVLENNQPSPGEPLLMPQTAGAASMSLVTQPSTVSPTTGQHLHVYVIGNTATGTITFAGLNASGGVQSSQTYHVAVAPQNALGYTHFTTTEIWSSINANGITLSSGLTSAGCLVMIFGSSAGKYLLPITTDEEEKIAHFSPEDKRGILWKDFRVTQLTRGCSLDKCDCALYPDSLWIYYTLIGSTPVITTAPASPVSLLTSTAIASSMTLTTGPTAPGMFLIFTITGNTAAGTIVLGGTDENGVAYTSNETITFTSAANQTVYSQRRYSVVNNGGANKFATTGGTSSSIAVTGVFAFTFTWTYDGITNPFPLSGCLSIFDGVMGKMLPGVVFSDGTFTYEKEKEISFSGKGNAQDLCIVGDPNPTTYPSGTNPFATLAQPTSLPMVSWPATFYIDTGASGTPFTTQTGILTSLKIALQTGRKWEFAGSGMQRADFVVTDAAPSMTLDATGIFTDYSLNVGYFEQNTALILGALFQGKLLGATGGTVYFEQVKWTLPAKIDTYKPDKSKNAVEVAFKTLNEYNAVNLGYAYRVAVTAAIAPTYTS